MAAIEIPKCVAVIGAGTMGHGIAQVFSHAGFQVMLQDLDVVILDNAESRIRSNLTTLFEDCSKDAPRINEIISRISRTQNLAEAVANADFVLESVSEDLEVKIELFEQIESLSKKSAIFASNTSMLRISDIGRKVRDKERLIVTHWFNPPYLIPVVEVIKGPETSSETFERTATLLEMLGKSPIRLLKEVPGHLINRIQFAMLRETLSLLRDGVATVEEIDRAVSESLGLRLAVIGPLRGMDFSGIDIFWYGMQNMHKYQYESPDPRLIIEEMIKTGHTGKKSGKGFYEYERSNGTSKEEIARDRKIMRLLAALHSQGESANG